VRAIVEALADGMVDDPAETERYLRTAQREVQALSRLIDDLFDMAQIEAGGLEVHAAPNSIADLVSDTIESFSAVAAAAGVEITGAAAPGVDPVTMDAELVGRVLANLVSNALRHTPAGGRVHLEAERERDGVRVTVADTGEGIAPEELGRVFERYYRSDPARGRAGSGAGLGLAIARGIVEAHGGRIGIESTPGAGTRVSFRLPGS
jgi:signal transduction histidine kinase